jgi:polyisoprenoid-binding protein YceI
MRVRYTLPALLGLLLLVPNFDARAADTFNVDSSHSNVGFKIRHLISYVTGRFGDFKGSLLLDSADPTRSSATFTIQAASIDTAEPKRDAHLKSPDFFDVAKFPEMTFKSTKIAKVAGDSYKVTGSFTLHGVTREITIPVEFLGIAKDPWGNERAGFSTSFAIDRKDYGIVWNKVLDAGGTFVGDEVVASINLEMVKAKPAEPAPAK